MHGARMRERVPPPPRRPTPSTLAERGRGAWRAVRGGGAARLWSPGTEARAGVLQSWQNPKDFRAAQSGAGLGSSWSPLQAPGKSEGSPQAEGEGACPWGGRSSWPALRGPPGLAAERGGQRPAPAAGQISSPSILCSQGASETTWRGRQSAPRPNHTSLLPAELF